MQMFPARLRTMITEGYIVSMELFNFKKDAKERGAEAA